MEALDRAIRLLESLKNCREVDPNAPIKDVPTICRSCREMAPGVWCTECPLEEQSGRDDLAELKALQLVISKDD